MPTSQPVDQGITWSFAPLDQLRFMRAKYVQHAFAPHAHDYYVISIIEDGVQTFKHGRNQHVTTPGKLIVINPGEVHTGEAARHEGFVYRAMYPSANLLGRLMETFKSEAMQLPQFPGGTVQDVGLFHQMQRLHQQSERAVSGLELEEGLLNFLVEFTRRYAASSPVLPHYQQANQAVRQVCDYLEAHYDEPVTLADLSAQVHITPYHLTRLFSRQMGIPPHRYLENIRIHHAERLLASGIPIAEVAYATGFSSQSHLTRTFKRFIGTTPGEYLQQGKIV